MTSAAELDELGRELRRVLIEYLTQAGALVSPRWIAAFLAVPRHTFVPRFFVDRQNDGNYEVLNRADPEHGREWLKYVYSDDSLVTQMEGDEWMSSSSQPSLMARMLESLSVTGGERVLEIGTGTGYNAALMSEMLGDEYVTSVDIDTGLVDEARDRLHSAGYRPTLAATDGACGYPKGAPFDRVIATCSVERIPQQWISQSSIGGLILANLYRDLGGGALARLRVSSEGASGHFAPFFGGFMPTRTYAAVSGVDLLQDGREGDGARRSTEVTGTVLDDDAFAMFAALRVPAQRLTLTPESGEDQFWLLGRDGSWAYQTHEHGSSVAVQGGPVKLWDELEDAYVEWVSRGRPAREEFGLTVTLAGEHLIWHGSPDGQTRRLPPLRS